MSDGNPSNSITTQRGSKHLTLRNTNASFVPLAVKLHFRISKIKYHKKVLIKAQFALIFGKSGFKKFKKIFVSDGNPSNSITTQRGSKHLTLRNTNASFVPLAVKLDFHISKINYHKKVLIRHNSH